MFIDGFNPLAKFILSILGVYGSLGNLPVRLRGLAVHLFTILLSPPGMHALHRPLPRPIASHARCKLLTFRPRSASEASPLGALQPVVDDVLRLQRGLVVSLGHLGNVFVTGGVGCITADFPEGNGLCDCKSHNATVFCRRCLRRHDEMAATDAADPAPPRTEHELRRRQGVLERLEDFTSMCVLLTDCCRRLLSAPCACPSVLFRDELETVFGMIVQANPLRQLHLDRPRQIPYEIFHNEGLGVNRTLFECFWRLLSANARCVSCVRLSAYVLPPTVIFLSVSFSSLAARLLLTAQLPHLLRPQGWPVFPDLSKFAVWRGKDFLRSG
jgi:hypothetical protein